MEKLEPLVRMQVNSLLRFTDIEFKVEEIRKGAERAEFADRFVVLVPCCAEHLRWHVVYNVTSLKSPPDVIFGPDDESFQPLVAFGSKFSSTDAQVILQLLQNWDIYDPRLLVQLIVTLRNLYLLHQRRHVEDLSDSRVRFELSTMGTLQGIDVLLLGGPDKPEEVQFAIPLRNIDVSAIEALQGGAAPPPIVLQLKFPLARGGGRPPPVNLKLVAPPAVMEALSLTDARMPAWTETTCTVEYLPALQSHIQQQVDEAAKSVELRKAFMSAVPAFFGRPLEIEVAQFRRVSVFVTCNGFAFLVHMSIPMSFPKQQPVITLQSSQHFDPSGRPITSQGYDDYAWSPRWDPEEMVRRICSFIQDVAPTFKRFCSERR